MIGDWLQDHTNFPMQVRVVGEDYLYADFEDNYVHEMQQVLRLAGLTDIANNFKV